MFHDPFTNKSNTIVEKFAINQTLTNITDFQSQQWCLNKLDINNNSLLLFYDKNTTNHAIDLFKYLNNSIINVSLTDSADTKKLSSITECLQSHLLKQEDNITDIYPQFLCTKNNYQANIIGDFDQEVIKQIIDFAAACK